MTKTITQEIDCSAELFLEQCASRVVCELKNAIKAYKDKPLVDAIHYASLGGGKRVRPGLVYATASALDLEFELVDPIACAIELIHCYSLTHDDLPAMDDDAMRRGKPSCHKAFGEAEAILAGNAMQALAFECLADAKQLSDTHKLKTIRMLASAAGLSGMASGQAMDIKGVDSKIDLAYLERTHRLKTGSLMATCITMPLACKDNCLDSICRALIAFSSDIGLCFQIQDDILDACDQEQNAKYPNKELDYPSAIGMAETQKLLKKLSDDCLHHLDCIEEKAEILRTIARYITTRDI